MLSAPRLHRRPPGPCRIQALERTSMNPLYALAAAAAKDPPIIDLDSTVLVQLVIFIITAVVLSRFLFKPYLAVRAARGAGIEGARDEARRMDEEAKARIADYETAFNTA